MEMLYGYVKKKQQIWKKQKNAFREKGKRKANWNKNIKCF